MSEPMPQAGLLGRHVLFVFGGPEVGGAERQGLHLARHLKQLGARVSVWSTQAGPGRLEAACRDAGFPYHVQPFRWPCRKSSLLRDGVRLLRALWRDRPDVLLPYTTAPNMGCGLVWRASPARVCIWGQRNVHGLQGRRLERVVYRRVSAVVCNASHEVEYLRRTLGFTPASVNVVPNGTALEPARRSRADWRSALGIPDEAIVVTMLANLRAMKNHAALLHAWRHLLALSARPGPSPFLVLAGAPQDAAAEVQRLVDALGITGHVRLPGAVTDVSGLLSASDIGVLTSLHEGLPNALLEYMAAGLPVLASDVAGNREALGDDARQLIAAIDDPARLAAAFQTLIQDTTRRADCGARNRERVVAMFAMPAMCASMTDLISHQLAAAERRG